MFIVPYSCTSLCEIPTLSSVKIGEKMAILQINTACQWPVTKISPLPKMHFQKVTPSVIIEQLQLEKCPPHCIKYRGFWDVQSVPCGGNQRVNMCFPHPHCTLINETRTSSLPEDIGH